MIPLRLCPRKGRAHPRCLPRANERVLSIFAWPSKVCTSRRMPFCSKTTDALVPRSVYVPWSSRLVGRSVAVRHAAQLTQSDPGHPHFTSRAYCRVLI